MVLQISAGKKLLIAEHLEELAAGRIEPLRRDLGICYELMMVFGRNAEAYCSQYFKTWEHYSGSSLYPVPHPDSDFPARAFNDSMEHWKGAYGDLRRNLCEHIARELRLEIKE